MSAQLIRKELSISECFGIKSAGTLPGYEPNSLAPAIDPGYLFRPDLLRDMIAFYLNGDIAMYLRGLKGSGKTTLVEQFHARLNLPLLIISASNGVTEEKLLGQWIPQKDGSLEFRYAGVLRAALYGISVLIDEYNTIRPEYATGTNQLLEGKPYDVPETGDRIVPQPGFRVFATGNPNDGVSYLGRENLDGANEDRFFWLDVPYATKEEEMQILNKKIADSGLASEGVSDMVEQFCEVAQRVRQCYKGAGVSGDSLTSVLSTRTLLRWAKYASVFRHANNLGRDCYHYALERAFTMADSMTDASRLAIHEIVFQVTGKQYDAAKMG